MVTKDLTPLANSLENRDYAIAIRCIPSSYSIFSACSIVPMNLPDYTFDLGCVHGMVVPDPTGFTMTSKRGKHAPPRFMSAPPLRIAFLHPDLGIGMPIP